MTPLRRGRRRTPESGRWRFAPRAQGVPVPPAAVLHASPALVRRTERRLDGVGCTPGLNEALCAALRHGPRGCGLPGPAGPERARHGCRRAPTHLPPPPAPSVAVSRPLAPLAGTCSPLAVEGMPPRRQAQGFGRQRRTVSQTTGGTSSCPLQSVYRPGKPPEPRAAWLGALSPASSVLFPPWW